MQLKSANSIVMFGDVEIASRFMMQVLRGKVSVSCIVFWLFCILLQDIVELALFVEKLKSSVLRRHIFFVCLSHVLMCAWVYWQKPAEDIGCPILPLSAFFPGDRVSH